MFLKKSSKIIKWNKRSKLKKTTNLAFFVFQKTNTNFDIVNIFFLFFHHLWTFDYRTLVSKEIFPKWYSFLTSIWSTVWILDENRFRNVWNYSQKLRSLLKTYWLTCRNCIYHIHEFSKVFNPMIPQVRSYCCIQQPYSAAITLFTELITAEFVFKEMIFKFGMFIVL